MGQSTIAYIMIRSDLAQKVHSNTTEVDTMQTFKQWHDTTQATYFVVGEALIVPDSWKLKCRSELWHLTDYRVSAISGGTILLVKR